MSVLSRTAGWVLMLPVALAVMVAFSWGDEAVSSIEIAVALKDVVD